MDPTTPNLSALTGGKSAMAYALQGLAGRPRQGSESSWTPDSHSSASEKEVEPVLESQPEGERPPEVVGTEQESIDIGHGYQPSDAEALTVRRKNIQVVIQDSGKQGRYTFTADDPELREIIKAGIEREAGTGSGKSRSRFRDLVFTRQFTTFDRQNPRAAQSPFHGFFTLFWLAMALLLLKIAALNWKIQGSVFGRAEIVHLMIDRDLFVLLATDGAMCLATSSGFLLQKTIAKGYLTWDGSGWIIQSVWQAFFTGTVIWFSFYREWPWTHTVFIVLHVFVLLMKQHSYGFTNGYLSRVLRRKNLLQEKLEQLESLETTESSSPVLSPTLASGTDLRKLDTSRRRRRSMGPKYSTDFSSEGSEIALMAKAIEAGSPLDESQIQAFTRVIETEITILDEELRGKSTSPQNAYPSNLTLSNFVDWACLPTLVYELEYPRQPSINWYYVAEKSAATLGVIWTMIIVSQAYIYPVVMETIRQRDVLGVPLETRWKEFPSLVSDMLFPLLLEQLLAWYVIWECLLNVLAEVTRFADRSFYGDWWNSTSWDQYARDWNRPVHHFLLRHVYHSSISALRLSRLQATFVTFLLSAVVHELLMFCLFKKVRGYLFALQLAQLPLAALSRTRLLRGRDTLGNVIFWFGLFIGPSVLTGLYLVV